jgi:flagellar biosynthesis anti-sigma factor FlgM
MEILPNRDVGQADRRRQVENRQGRQAADASMASGAGSDDLSLGMDPERVQRFVDELRSTPPERLHKVEDLRQQIAEGSYRADPEELADALLAMLDGEPPAAS